MNVNEGDDESAEVDKDVWDSLLWKPDQLIKPNSTLGQSGFEWSGSD